MKKVLSYIILMFTAVFVLLAGCSLKDDEKSNTDTINMFDYKTYENEALLVTDSDSIVIGQIVKVNKPEDIVIGKAVKNPNAEIITNNDKYMTEKEITLIYTVSEFKVEQVLKGDYETGQIIEVKQPGDISNPEYTEGIEYFKENTRQILFLKTYPNVPASVLNPIQGQIDLTDNKITKLKQNSLFENIQNEDDLIKEINQKMSIINNQK